MVFYSETLQMCDRILAIFSAERPAGESESNFVNILKLERGSKEIGLLTPAIQRLEQDTHLVRYGHHNDIFKIGATTLEFKELGGYKEWVEKEIRNQELRKTLEELGVKTNQNVIDTGDSVQRLNSLLKPATKVQVFASILTVIVAGLAAWISWIGYKRQDSNDDLKSHLKSLKEEVQKMKEIQDKMLPVVNSLPAPKKDLLLK